MDLENFFIAMGILNNMKEILLKVLKKEKENIFMKMENIMRGISIIIFFMEKVKYFMLMIIFIMKVIFLKMKKMVKVFYIIKKVKKFMKEILNKINLKEKGNIFMIMGITILVLLKIIKEVDMGNIILKVGILFMKEILLGML